jgi:hypothetical protein
MNGYLPYKLYGISASELHSLKFCSETCVPPGFNSFDVLTVFIIPCFEYNLLYFPEFENGQNAKIPGSKGSFYYASSVQV